MLGEALKSENLFILCMNNSGSTLLQKFLAESENVLQLPEKNGVATSAEGHNIARGYMPHPRDHEVLGIWTEKESVFTDSKLYQWEKIKESWMTGWSQAGAVDGKILLEKSPPNPIRAELLENNFPNSYFISMQRNPYAVCEGIRRRQNYSLERCAEHWGRVARHQIRNLNHIKKIIHLSYEDLCDNQEEVCKKLNLFIPKLKIKKFNKTFTGHHSIIGKKVMQITNLNDLQISNLTNSDITKINSVLSKFQIEMKFFNYKFI